MIKIKVQEREKADVVSGVVQYVEEQSSQEGKLSFFIAVNDGHDIEFFPESVEDMDGLIRSLSEIRDSMWRKVESGEMKG